MMKIFVTTICFFLCLGAAVQAQYFQFSQYNFTPQRINPAMVGSTDYATASFLYRNQSTGGGFNLNSNILNASYPLFNRRQVRWAGVGLSLLDDRAGQSGIFVTQEVSASYAIHVPLARWQTLSLGVNVLHAKRRLDLGGLYTGSQYIEDRGFDGGIGNGEPLDNLQNKFFTFSSGLYWQQLDKSGNKLASFSFSFFDLNRPDESFLQESSAYASTFVIAGSFLGYSQDNIMISPDLLYTRNAGRNVLNAGFTTSYELNRYKDKPSDKIDLITRYVIGRSGIVGLQFHRENMSFGVSYDFPLLRRNVANTGAIELGIVLRKLVDPKARVRKKNQKEKQKLAVRRSTPKATNVKQSLPVAKDTAASKSIPPKTDMSARLRHKQDSVQALVNPGQLQHEPLVLEEATLRFGFDFARSELDENSKAYLDELAQALTDNTQLEVALTGHTDNVGSQKFNQRLSLERAMTLKKELVKRGVSEARIQISGKGMSEPLNGNTTPEERAQNRRVEMKIYYTD